MKLTHDHPSAGLITEQTRLSSAWAIALIVAALLVFLALDTSTGAAPVQHLYYWPIVFAGVRFGRRGGLMCAAAAIVLYHIANPHALTFRDEQPDLLQMGVFVAAGVLSARLADDARRLRKMALTDDLTGLHNLRSFEQRLGAVLIDPRNRRADYVVRRALDGAGGAREIVVVAIEAAIETEGRLQRCAADESAGGIAAAAQRLGEGGHARPEAKPVVGADAVRGRVQSGEHARVRRQSERNLRHRGGETERVLCKAIERRRQPLRGAVGTESIGAQRVDGDEDNGAAGSVRHALARGLGTAGERDGGERREDRRERARSDHWDNLHP